MAFDSYAFLFVFLPTVLVVYHLFRATRLHNWVICIASLYFYSWGSEWYLILVLLFVSIQDFIIGRWIFDSEDERTRKALMIASVSSNLFVLGLFKYGNWIIHSIALPLPIGISFYTFHTISYTVDIYRRRMVPRTNLIDYMSFVSFFPLLVAGPIQRASHLLPQIARIRPPVSWRNAEHGFFLICWGLTKKMVFADNLGKLVERCQENISEPGVGLVLALAFTFQIYADFSAYTDIARGCARFFNISLTKNFLTPYFSASPSEFWHRWHISLSTFLRDYLYIPLGGSRGTLWQTLANLMITMTLGGLWHGAGVFFVIWGIYHGVLLCLHRVFPLDERLRGWFGQRLGTVLAVGVMFCCTVFGWILFFSNPRTFFPIVFSIGTMVTNGPSNLALTLSWGLVLFVTPLIVTDAFGYKRDREFVDLYPRFSLPLKVLSYVAMFYLVVFLARRSGYAFIYFQF